MSFNPNFAAGNSASNFQTRGNSFQSGFNTGTRDNSNGARGSSNRGGFGGSNSNFRGSNPRMNNREVNSGTFGNSGGRRGGSQAGGSFARPTGPGNFGAPFGTQGPTPAITNPWGMNSNPRQNSGARPSDRGSRGARSNSGGPNMGSGYRQNQPGPQNPWSGAPNSNNFGNNFDARQTASPNQNNNFERQNSKPARVQSRPTGSKQKGFQQPTQRTGESFGPQGQVNSNFGTTSTGFGQTPSSGFGQPTSTGFGQPSPGFGQAPAFGFSQPATGFGQTSSNFRQPQSNFQQATEQSSQNFSRIGRGRGVQPQKAASPVHVGPTDRSRGRFPGRGDRPSTNFPGQTDPAGAPGFGGGVFVPSGMMNELERTASLQAGSRVPEGDSRRARDDRGDRGRRGGRGKDGRGDGQLGNREPRSRGGDPSNVRGGRGRERDTERRGPNNRERGRGRGGSKPGNREGGALALRIKKNTNPKPAAKGKPSDGSEESGSYASDRSDREGSAIDSQSYSRESDEDEGYSRSDGYGDPQSEGSNDYSSERDLRNKSGSGTPPSPPRRKPSNPYKDEDKQPNIHQRIVVSKGTRPGQQTSAAAVASTNAPSNPRLRVRTSTAVAATLKKFDPI